MNQGRPRKIDSPEHFDDLVESYVVACKTDEVPLTLTGMILALGLSSRQSLDEYANYEGFSDSIKRAKLLVENQYEIALHSPAATGSIFALKNFGWKDKQDIEHSGNLNLSSMSDEELALKIAAMTQG